MSELAEARAGVSAAITKRLAEQVVIMASEEGRGQSPSPPVIGDNAFDDPTRKLVESLRKNPVVVWHPPRD